MTRLRVAVVAVLAAMSFAAIAVPAASASNGTTVRPNTTLPTLDTVHVTGSTAGGRQFSGTYKIQRFAARGNKAFAFGTLTGTLNGQHITRYNVRMPASLVAPTTPAVGAARTAAATCPVLHLTLGPIDLNLLGLHVTTNQIVVDITAIPGAGNLLGNLLCDLTGLLNQPGILTALNQDLQQLTSTLTSLTSLLGGLPVSL